MSTATNFSETVENGIRKEISKSPIIVSRVYKSEYQKEGTLTAELKQTIATKAFYPTKSVSNSLNDNIFSTTDFGFADQEFTSKETRVAWIDVPAVSTVESVQAKINSIPTLTLYKIMANKPIIADTEQYAIDSPELNVTTDTIANRQVVRYPDTHETHPGEIVLDRHGKVQYRRIAFSVTVREDVDSRTEDVIDVYVSPEIQAELDPMAIPSQTL